MIYFTILILLLFLSYQYDYLGRTRYKEQWFILMGILLICIAGFRYRMGIDSIRYETKYSFVPLLWDLTYEDIFHNDLKSEPLFMLLYSIAKTISNEFWVMQILQSFLVVSIFWRFIKKNTQYWFITIFLFTLVLFLNFTFEILRESCAVSMFLLGWEYYKNKKWLRYYICAICAMFFHSGAIFLLIIPIVDVLKIPKIIEKGPVTIAMLIVSVLIGGSLIQAHFADYFQLLSLLSDTSSNLIDKVDLYSDSRLSGQVLNIKGIITSLISNMLYPIIALYVIQKKRLCHPAIRTMLFWALIISVLEIPVSLMYRFNNYFLPFVIIALSDSIFSDIKTNVKGRSFWKKSYASCLLILVPYIVIQLYSYRSPVGNTRYRMYEIYTPYSSIFDKTEPLERKAIYSYYGAE